MIDVLVRGGCGAALPHDPLWQCFLSTGKSKPQQQTTAGFGIGTIGGSRSNGAAGAGGGPPDRSSLINQIGMDAAKQHCCPKAASSMCRRMCVQTFTNDWTRTRERFETECYGQALEAVMRQCLEEGECLICLICVQYSQ